MPLPRVVFFTAAALCACSSVSDGPVPPSSGKQDTGWVSNTSFEVGGVIRSTVRHRAEGSWAALGEDRALQERLIDAQLKFGKRDAMARGYALNQLFHRIVSLTATTEGDEVILTYEATIDLNAPRRAGKIPTLAELGDTRFSFRLPADPIDMLARLGDRCALDPSPYTLSEISYYYYFNADKAGCDRTVLPISNAAVELKEVYADRVVYPEYDQLLQPLGGGRVGFRAALLPTLGDDRDLEIFDNIKFTLEQRLGVTGERSSDGTYVSYAVSRGGATMLIDLFDPTRVDSFLGSFQDALARYQLIHYAGHSEYGSKPLLSDASKYSSDYQIVMMWSCHSYAYYARQVFRAKATVEDPDGFSRADVVSTEPTPFFGDEDDGIVALLSGLGDGISAVERGDRAQAPSWLKILAGMNATSFDTPYGAAGARSNAWMP